MVRRDLVSRLALIALVLVVVLSIGCSSGKKQNNNNNNDEPPPPTTITGTVFADQDANGIKSATEAGIADVVVSNGVTSTKTGADGGFTLTKEGSFIFVTTPKGYAAAGQWYQPVSGAQFSFGLKSALERNSDNFTFIHMTDIHLDASNLVNFNKAVEEFKNISPAFVVSTGDLVNTGDKTTISEAQATQWFGAYKTAVAGLSMPVYNAVGNHDAANLACESAASATAGCSKSAFRNSFGPTYYSFDWGQYHCVVLDPNEVKAGSQIFEINASQMAWLQKDLSYREKGSRLLVFFHEPTAAWQSQASVLNLLKQYKTRIFSGHAHEDLLMSSQGIPEQVTAALSGEWGHGNNPDGSKPGYRIVSVVPDVVAGDVIDTFYKEIGSAQQMEIGPAGATWPIVSGPVELVAKVYSGNSTVSGVTYSVDNATAVAMTLATGSKWVTARVTWDTGALSQDYHKITVTATDDAGSFQTETEVKVSSVTLLTIKDLQDHLAVYWGHYVTIKGTVDTAMFGTSFAPPGAGGAVIHDNTGSALIYAGECYSPALPTLATGSEVEMKVIPMRFTWAFMTSTEDREGTFDMFTMQEGMVPEAQKVDDASGDHIARWFMRLVTADGITKL